MNGASLSAWPLNAPMVAEVGLHPAKARPIETQIITPLRDVLWVSVYLDRSGRADSLASL